MDLDDAMRLATRITGWMVPEELEWLYEQARTLPERASWLEVGVYAGRSLFAVAMGLPRDSWLWGVDQKLGTISDEILATHRAILYHRPDLRLVLCRAESVALSRHFADHVLDVVFLDGDHTYHGCKVDIEAWRRTVKVGGLLCGHDYNLPVHPGVVEAVNEIHGRQVHHSIWASPILPPPPPELLKIEEIVEEIVTCPETDAVSLLDGAGTEPPVLGQACSAEDQTRQDTTSPVTFDEGSSHGSQGKFPGYS